MAHSRVAEELVPTAVALVEEDQPLEVRCQVKSGRSDVLSDARAELIAGILRWQAILLFGMCLPSAPAAAEAHIAKVLHAPLEEALRSVPSPPLEREEDEDADEAGDDGERGDGSRNGSGDEREDDEAGDGDEDDGDGAVDEIDDAERGSCRPTAELKLSRCAHTVLADLCATRKLHPARELPKLLPFVADKDLGSATSACLRREGPIRWPRLLYLSALQLCPHLPTAELRATLGALLPEFLSSARQQELAQVGDALASQLGEAAAVALSASSGGLLLHNLAALLAAWPPTDRGLLALLRALGGGGGRGGAEGGDAPPPPLLAIARADRSLHSTLASHACARPQLRGSVVDEIAQLLGAKPRSAATTDTTARDSRADDRSQLESSARSTLGALREAKALYVTVKLPELHAAARRAKDDKVKEHLPKKRRRFASRSMEADEEDEE
ncbi:hypothetical protein AB1Y20_006345 [Prymnesium parvum]|uniref:Fanconi Anaemia group E protein C-terminal domain-containing protein n=1 Tax=Prymnesium parvum TaxID=97485 RepID=A0AB34J4U7_PRYPA